MLLIAALSLRLGGQNIYYPPLVGIQWDSVSPASLGWCTAEWDTLHQFLAGAKTRSFMILHRGKRVYEQYYHGFHRDSSWYWASAAKTMVAVLVGIAQQEALLDISQPSSLYLGAGWTAAPPAKEALITLADQLQMTTGLDFTHPDHFCIIDTCLQYRSDAGTEWYYYNAPYIVLRELLDTVSGQNLNQYTFQKLGLSTGMRGLWLNGFYFSTARHMARFGLLLLSEGRWNGQPVLSDTAYFRAMTQPSQNLNPAYGYLTWLNGQNFYRQPGTTFSFPGAIVPAAPADMYMAAGKNDQRIYVVPSLDLVVVRQGEEADSSLLALSGFDQDLWELLSRLLCRVTGLQENLEEGWEVFPNPTHRHLQLGTQWSQNLQLYQLTGQALPLQNHEQSIRLPHLPAGIYFLVDPQNNHRQKIVVKERP